MHRALHETRSGGEASRGGRQALHRLGASRRRRLHRGDGRQQRRREAAAHGAVERLVHDQLPRAGGLCSERRRRHRARLHDDDPFLYRRPEHGRHAAQGHAPRARRRAQHDPDLDRRREGAGPRHSRLAGQARRHRDPRADRQRVAHRLRLQRRARHLARGGERAHGEGGRNRTASRASSASSRTRSCRATSITTGTARPST